MRYTLPAVAFAVTVLAQDNGTVTTCNAYCGLTGAAQYLGEFGQNLAQTLPQLVDSVLPQLQGFIQQAVPNAAATDLPSLILQDNSLLPMLLGKIPQGALDSAEASVATSAAPAIWTSVVSSDLGPLFSSFPSTLPATDIPSFISASSSAFYPPFISVMSTLIPKLQAQLTSLESVAEPTGAPSRTVTGTPFSSATGAAGTTGSSGSAAGTTMATTSGTTTTAPSSASTTSVSKGAAPTLAANKGLVGGAVLAGALGVAAAML